MPDPPIIRTGRLVGIRHASAADESEFLELRRSSGSFLTRWEPIRAEVPVGSTPEIELFRKMIDFGEDRVPLLLERREDRAVVGVVNISQIARGAFQNCALGWWMGRRHAGRGYMKDGIALVLEHVFLDLGLHRAEANIQPNNPASRALARGVGMRQEGFSEGFLEIDGHWRDHERWAITRELWNQQGS